MNTFSGLKKTGDKNLAYLSTPHYLRQAVGVEKQGKNNNVTGSSSTIIMNEWMNEYLTLGFGYQIKVKINSYDNPLCFPVAVTVIIILCVYLNHNIWFKSKIEIFY